MIRLLAFGLAVGMGVQAWAQFPENGPVSVYPAMLIAFLGMVASYVGGRYRGHVDPVSSWASARAEARASASASARQQQAQAVTINLAGVDRPREHLTGVPDESVAWFGSPRQLLTTDQVEGFDYSDFGEELDFADETNEPKNDHP